MAIGVLLFSLSLGKEWHVRIDTDYAVYVISSVVFNFIGEADS